MRYSLHVVELDDEEVYRVAETCVERTPRRMSIIISVGCDLIRWGPRLEPRGAKGFRVLFLICSFIAIIDGLAEIGVQCLRGVLELLGLLPTTKIR